MDANILFAALLRHGTTRRLLLHGDLDLHTPWVIWDELDRNRSMLVRKSRATPASFDLLVGGLRAAVGTVGPEVLQPFRLEALRRTGPKDRLDAPYVAAALALGADLWTHDRRLAAKAGIPVVTTAELLAR